MTGCNVHDNEDDEEEEESEDEERVYNTPQLRHTAHTQRRSERRQ